MALRGVSVVVGVLGAVVALGAGCGDTVDCEALCSRTLACEVTFAPDDDRDGRLIVDGTRTDAESCALGCADSPRVTVEAARCIDGLEITGDNAADCQLPVMQCLGLADQVGGEG